MDGFKAYKYYMAIKLHFTKDNFDVFQNRGNIKGTREAFNARNDRYLFEKLARKYPVDKDLIQFFVANFAYSHDTSLYEYQEAEDNHTEWKRRKQSITKVLSDDCTNIIMNAYKDKIKTSSIFNFTNNQYPSILKLYLGKQITIETIRILDDQLKLLDTWKQNTSLLVLWEAELRRVEKLKGFVKYDQSKVVSVLKTFQEELQDLK
jgi:hypothetical protein